MICVDKFARIEGWSKIWRWRKWRRKANEGP